MAGEQATDISYFIFISALSLTLSSVAVKLRLHSYSSTWNPILDLSVTLIPGHTVLVSCWCRAGVAHVWSSLFPLCFWNL